MNTFFDFWYRIARANPDLNDESRKMTLTAGAFRKLMKRAYEQGHKDRSGGDTHDDLGIFGDLFGGKL